MPQPSPGPLRPGGPRARSPSRRPSRGRAGLALTSVLALGVAVFSLGLYGTASLDQLAEDGVGLGGAYAAAGPVFQGALYVHIVTASVALLLGPLQFVAALRRRALGLHRAVGRVYMFSVGLGGLSSLVLLPVNSAGFVGAFGFGALAVLWLLTGLRALRAVRSGDLAGHQAWMIRNYALTFAAVMLRLWLGVLIGVQVPFAGPETDAEALFSNAYAAVPFLCWLPNLVVAEWLVRRRGLPSYALPAQVPQLGSADSTSGGRTGEDQAPRGVVTSRAASL
ncbi:DUF2306 domain-containing protein [Actinotalea sp. BY-33]|uniref:DUF2306 domain-containing protein n=1 Tax=Actinotalea soli TaxID=2819234 RepID=A0A939LQJ2_9CELL|nr:DUF2306 domain-containing protein [Actinotalea soli]